MVQLTLLDHLRLTFGHVVYRHRAHARLAQSLTRWSRRLRAAEVLVVVAVAYTAGAAAFSKGQPYAIVSAILAGVALVMLVVHLTIDFDTPAQTHMICAGRLWLIRERYRALLTDLADGSVDVDGARRGRDALMNELHAIYERAAVVDHDAYQSAAQAAAALDDVSLSDEEIDKFLPQSLHKAGKSAA